MKLLTQGKNDIALEVLAHFALNVPVSQELYNIIAAQWNEHEAMNVPRLARVLMQISPEFIYKHADN